MNYGRINTTDIANGLGVRVSLFVSGCRHHCKGCFNPETWNFNYGDKYTSETEDYILNAVSKSYISGITLLGGDPFEPENQKDLLDLLIKVRKIKGKDVWCYTGYAYEGIMSPNSIIRTPYTMDLLNSIDVLVDGEFIEGLKDITLKFKGSSNQRVIDVKESLKSNEIAIYL